MRNKKRKKGKLSDEKIEHSLPVHRGLCSCSRLALETRRRASTIHAAFKGVMQTLQCKNVCRMPRIHINKVVFFESIYLP